jgi:hypothetical protein
MRREPMRFCGGAVKVSESLGSSRGGEDYFIRPRLPGVGKMGATGIVDRLLQSPEPSIRWKTMVGALGEDPGSSRIRRLREEIRRSPRVRKLLSRQDAAGRLVHARDPYAKWMGAHWVLVTLADIGYPGGDESLRPIASQVMDRWLGPWYETDFVAKSGDASYGKRGVPILEGRHRRCASQQGNALFAVLRLGLEDERADKLVDLLLKWQWPDGGWNCDRRPEAHVSSFHETWTPLRGLALFAEKKNGARAKEAARRAAEVFLSRRMYRRRSDGRPVHVKFTRLSYPPYWHYDVLAGLKVMAEAGLVRDRRCSDALELIESKRLPGGGWPAESRHYHSGATHRGNSELVDWGPTGSTRMNGWVTCDALAVLAAAGRLDD